MLLRVHSYQALLVRKHERRPGFIEEPKRKSGGLYFLMLLRTELHKEENKAGRTLQRPRVQSIPAHSHESASASCIICDLGDNMYLV